MQVVADGLVYQIQNRGGVSRLFSEILPRMCDIDETLNISLLTQGRLRQPLPQHERIVHRVIPEIERCLCPRRMWKSIVPWVRALTRRLWVGSGAGKIWHSTYFTMHRIWKGSSVVTVHDMIFERFPEFFKGPGADLIRERKKRCVESADAVICVSETTRQEVHGFYKLANDRVCVVPNACSDVFRRIEEFDDTCELPIDGPFLLYIGQRSEYKNFDLLIKAYASWSKKNDLMLVLVGGRPWSEEERKRLAQLNIHSRVHILANVTDKDLCRLYNKAAALVYPSLYEGFGIPLLEAMACGCPIVASKIPSTIEVAGDCPVYFNPSETDHLIDALDLVVYEGHHSDRILAGLEKIKTYSWDSTARKTLNVYRSVSGENN